MSEIDPNTGLPVIPSFLFNDKRYAWRWYVDKRFFYGTGEKYYVVALQFYREARSTVKNVPQSTWDKILRRPVKTKEVPHSAAQWVNYDSDTVETESLTSEKILEAALSVVERVITDNESSKLLGAYPPKRLDTVGDTE